MNKLNSLTHMQIETQSIPNIIMDQLIANKDIIKNITNIYKNKDIKVIITAGRGSSGNAAIFAKYCLENYCGIITSHAALSTRTIYKNNISFKNTLVIIFSQSGASHDLIEYTTYAKNKGAETLAFVNDENSDLAQIADNVIPLLAGVEKSIAATKSYIATLSALLQFVAFLESDKKLLNALTELPKQLTNSKNFQSQELLNHMKKINNIIILSRGYGLTVAKEAALKLKETCGLHAEAISSAEFIHGPIALISQGIPILFFLQDDYTRYNLEDTICELKAMGADISIIAPKNILTSKIKSSANILVELPESIHQCCDPFMAIQFFYQIVEKLSISKGLNPDKPPFLKKITKTI